MRKLMFMVSVIGLSSCSHSSYEQAKPIEVTALRIQDEVTQKAEPFVVLELFTSEGCSDCPAAETWLNELTRDAVADRAYIYPLSFHVDYWNKLGWRDVFSDSAHSNRQRRYRRAFGNEVVYTPQMVVNGKVEFVGSDRDRTRKEIKRALSQRPPLYFHIEPNEDWTALSYTVVEMEDSIRTSMEDHSFQVAIVQRGLITEIKRGENKNKTLEHENVVRYFEDFPLTKGTTVELNHDLDITNTNFSIVALVQDRETMNIVGANIWNY